MAKVLEQDRRALVSSLAKLAQRLSSCDRRRQELFLGLFSSKQSDWNNLLTGTRQESIHQVFIFIHRCSLLSYGWIWQEQTTELEGMLFGTMLCSGRKVVIAFMDNSASRVSAYGLGEGVLEARSTSQ